MIQQIRRVFKESLDLKTSECCCGTRQVNQHCNLVKMGTDKGIPTQWQGGWGRWRGLPKGTGTMMRRGCFELELEGFLQGRQAEKHSWRRCVLCGEWCRNALHQVIWKKD